MTGEEIKIQTEGLSISFGSVKALVDISLDIQDKQILAIISPNGAGKTCVLNCISGFYEPQSDEIYYQGKRITNIYPDKIVARGIARTFLNIELYTGLGIQDNFMATRPIGATTPQKFSSENCGKLVTVTGREPYLD